MKRLRRNYGCPVELSLDFVGGKWRTVILAWLKEAPHRYGELRKRVPGLTDKVLTQQLKELEALGLISKKPVGERARSPRTCTSSRPAANPCARCSMPCTTGALRWRLN